jgi:uncharacterized membrane protein
VHKAGGSDAERIKGAIAYLLGFVTGLIILFIGRKSKFLRFHAWQSIIGSLVIGCTVSLVLISVLAGPVLVLALTMWLFILLAYLWYDAYLIYHGIHLRIPFVAGFIDKYLVK